MAEETKPPEVPDKKGKKGGKLQKYKWYIIGGIVVLGILFVAIRSANKNANAASSAQTPADVASQNGINPATGYLYGSPADLAAQGSSGTVAQGPPGPPGPAGPAGPAGPTGAAGKTSLPAPIHAPPAAAAGGHYTAPKPVTKPAAVSHTYTVKPGDNLSKIASHLGVSGGWQSLYAKNKAAIGKNPNLIHPGLKLKY